MAHVTTNDPMTKETVRSLAIYLSVCTILTVVPLVALWSAQPLGATGQVPKPTCTAGIPPLTNIYPDHVSAGAAGDVLLIGCGFPANTIVKFDDTQHQAQFINSGLIRVPLATADVAVARNLVITLSSGAAVIGTGVLEVLPAGVYWHLFAWGPWFLSQEVQLLLMVLLTGCFGSCVYALKSMADYRGDNKLFTSWITFYIVQPFEGAGIALLLYLTIRGGFLAGGGSDVKAVNQFGMCAIAGLAGAFSDIAFMKLREVFQTLFKPQDDRGGKVTPPKITSDTLPDGTVGKAYNETLKISGGVSPFKWSVSPALPAPLALDPVTGAITGTPTAPSKATYKFTVTDHSTPPVAATADLSLEIKAATPGASTTAAASTTAPPSTTPAASTTAAVSTTPPASTTPAPSTTPRTT